MALILDLALFWFLAGASLAANALLVKEVDLIAKRSLFYSFGVILLCGSYRTRLPEFRTFFRANVLGKKLLNGKRLTKSINESERQISPVIANT